jgi:hypothetical protein
MVLMEQSGRHHPNEAIVKLILIHDFIFYEALFYISTTYFTYVFSKFGTSVRLLCLRGFNLKLATAVAGSTRVLLSPSYSSTNI